MSDDLLDELDHGRRRAAVPDASMPGGWRVDPDVQAGILALFREREPVMLGPDEAFRFVDRRSLPVRRPPGSGRRIVPGGTTLRAGTYLGAGVVVMPPSYVNVGAYLGADTMVDSHVLVGSCAQVGERVHLSAGVTIGGVLEPPGSRPVIVEDEAFIGAGCAVLEGVVVGRQAVLGAGVTLTAGTRIYDLVDERVITGTLESPLAVPPRAVVVPGSRRLDGPFAEEHGLSVAAAVLVKYRDVGTDARTALQAALR